jgi:DNA processing protein
VVAVNLDDERRARVALTFLAQPGDPIMGAALQTMTPVELLAVITGADEDGNATLDHQMPDPALERIMPRWRERLGEVPSVARLAAWQQSGMRVIIPGDAEWPSQLDDLGAVRPVVLWAHGNADLRAACLNSVSIVGSRAATAYGNHVALEMAAIFAEQDLGVMSGGAFGIDASAHRGALAAEGLTVAVLAGGLNHGYPQGHSQLFAAIAAQGTLISECPPDRAPTRPGFLVRNRLIAALSRGTVVVEAALRSGALNTAKHARELVRPVMAVPGPVTSEYSAGCHELIRDYGAMLVTCARDVLDHLAPPGAGSLTGPRGGPSTARDGLDPVTTAVLEQVPVRGGRGPASIAVGACVDLDTALRCLGALQTEGLVARGSTGWTVARHDVR